MKLAAYCRVSTDKQDQLNSLEAQKQFFTEYAVKTGHTLVRVYADEGISGTKIKNRKQFLQMMKDGEKGEFNRLVVKDISRFARNTVDLLQSIRKLRSWGIETQFLTADMNTVSNSEFVLTVFAALAQEESANTSKRVKFGKRINAEKGRVPNLVFGYDKVPEDCFQMKINPFEASCVREIFSMYINNGYGGAKIADELNKRGVFTKRGCRFTQNSVCRILENPIYTGIITNGKEEVSDFLTGKRVKKSREEYLTVCRPELAIIDSEVFREANIIKSERAKKYKTFGIRHSGRYLFSTLIKCDCCGRSYRRYGTAEGGKWVCPAKGTGCKNRAVILEEELIMELNREFTRILHLKEKDMKKIKDRILSDTMKESELETSRNKTDFSALERSKERYTELYVKGIIDEDTLKNKLRRIGDELERLGSKNFFEENRLKNILDDSLQNPCEFTDVSALSNTLLKEILEEIRVTQEGRVKVKVRNLTFCAL